MEPEQGPVPDAVPFAGVMTRKGLLVGFGEWVETGVEGVRTIESVLKSRATFAFERSKSGRIGTERKIERDSLEAPRRERHTHTSPPVCRTRRSNETFGYALSDAREPANSELLKRSPMAGFGIWSETVRCVLEEFERGHFDREDRLSAHIKSP